MGVRKGQGYGVPKPKRARCPECGKKGVKQWYVTAHGLYHVHLYFHHDAQLAVFRTVSLRVDASELPCLCPGVGGALLDPVGWIAPAIASCSACVVSRMSRRKAWRSAWKMRVRIWESPTTLSMRRFREDSMIVI